MNAKDKFRELREMVQREIKTGNHRRMQELLVEAIADRRERDVIDIIAGVEVESGWSEACKFLLQVENSSYTSPIGIKAFKASLEPLKFREVVFYVFYSSGFEPIDIPTRKMVKNVRSCESLSSACKAFRALAIEKARKQFDKGDTLFFDFTKFGGLDDELLNSIRKIRNANLPRVDLTNVSDQIDITRFWYSEICRRHFIERGIKGTQISGKELSDVLYVIQQRCEIPPLNGNRNVNENSSHPCPNNEAYHELHKALIDQNIDVIASLGSRHAVPVLNSITNRKLMNYRKREESGEYREFIKSLHPHIVVRSDDSVEIFQKLVEGNAPRILTPVIATLSNFYNTSSASAIASVLGRITNPTIVENCLQAIRNLYMKCPEVLPKMRHILTEGCHNSRKLSNLVNEFSKRGPGWYYKYY